MKILFAAPETAWGGFLAVLRKELPEYTFDAAGRFEIESLKGYDILIPTMSQVTRSLMENSDRLRLIQQCGAGLEGVDIAAASDHRIWVANVPTDVSGNADSVAELGIYMMIGLSRNFRRMNQTLSEGQVGSPIGKAISGKTVGLVGIGGIGKALIQRLKAFNVRIVGIKASEPKKAQSELGLDWVGFPEELPSLLQKSDFVVLCLPVTAESQHLMNARTFSYMKKEAFLINLSRGGIVDRDALEDALASGTIAGAGLDVFWREPPDPDDPIFSYNVLATPHIGGATDISAKGIMNVVIENIRRVEKNRQPLYLKNP